MSQHHSKMISRFVSISADLLTRHAKKDDHIYVKYRKISTDKEYKGGIYVRGVPDHFIRLQSTFKPDTNGQMIMFSVQITSDMEFFVRDYHNVLLQNRQAHLVQISRRPHSPSPVPQSPLIPSVATIFDDNDWLSTPPPIPITHTGPLTTGPRRISHDSIIGHPTHQKIVFETDSEEEVIPYRSGAKRLLAARSEGLEEIEEFELERSYPQTNVFIPNPLTFIRKRRFLKKSTEQ